MKQFITLLLVTTVLLACHNAPRQWQGGGTVVPFRYARLIHISDCDSFRVARVDNPWKAGMTLHTYVLVPYDRVLPAELPEGTIVRTPLRRSIIFTSVHCALADQLDARSQVAGVADLKYIKVPFVQEGCRSGQLIDCGEGMSPVIEKIIDANADAILLSPFENSGGYGRLEDVEIPLVECAEYMETSPLARAEWMRFYGMLYGKEQQADSLFAVVDSAYHALCLQAEASPSRRSVILDKLTGSVWYVPGGKSTIGCMLRDAQCVYPFSDDNHSGSLSLPFEAVLERGGDSDVWLLRYDSDHPLTMSQLLSENQGYTQLKAVNRREESQVDLSSPEAKQSRPKAKAVNRREESQVDLSSPEAKAVRENRNQYHMGSTVFACNVTTSMFYEETPFRPDLLLQDLIQILHPDITTLPPLRYYFPVE